MNPPLTFVAFAFSRGGDFGGIGLEFYYMYTRVTRPPFKSWTSSPGRISKFDGLREKEKAAGGSGWGARKKRPGSCRE